MFDVAIIDDEKWIRELIRKLLPLERYSLQVTGEAEDGREGLDLVKRTRPDIILTDIRMPVLSGLELIENIRILLPKAEIIIISGFDNFEYAQKAIKSGVSDFLLKPVEKEELEKAIGKAIERLRKRRMEQEGTAVLERQVKRLTTEYPMPSEEEFPLIENEKIRAALKYIHENFSRPLSLNEMCDVLVLNVSYFSELFKKEVGKGFNRYLNELRFAKAEDLLLNHRELAIGDIARIIGFQDANYFSRIFRKTYKCTAQEFRKGQAAAKKERS
ncbi:MAG: response regulator [Spirochaetales bacterium]|nr:response regulator [Spirochaetales bacterium]